MIPLQLQKILVAVANPSRRSNKAVSRAAELAHRTGASSSSSMPFRPRKLRSDMRRLRSLRDAAAVAQNRADLERIANRLRREELAVKRRFRRAMPFMRPSCGKRSCLRRIFRHRGAPA